MTGNSTVIAVVLAAGLSTRFGGDKLLHPYRGRPLASHIAETVAASPVTHRIAICAAGNAELAAVFLERGFEVIENADPARGMATSLVLGAKRAAALHADTMLICLADMPNISAEHIARLMEAEGDVVATEADGVRSPPARFAAVLLPQLSALTGDKGARELLRSATPVTAPAEMVRDFDTPADFD